MAYGNYGAGYYPYQPMYPQNGAMPDMLSQYKNQYQLQMPQQPAQANSSGGIIWVQGEEGAKAYLVAPGCTVVLWDSENPVIYIKSADQSGVPYMRIIDWTERTQGQKFNAQNKPNGMEKFVTFDVLDNILDDKIDKKLAEINKPKKAKETKEVDNG